MAPFVSVTLMIAATRIATDFSTLNPVLVTATVYVAFTVYIAVVVGRRVLQFLGAGRGPSTGERFTISAAVGIGLLQFVPFMLGALGVLGTTSVRVVMATIGIASLFDAPVVVRAGRRWWHGRRTLSAWEWVWVVLIAAPLVFGFLRALAPAYDPDGLGYHLTAPKRWLQLGSLDFLPTLTYTHGPMGTEMLFASALAIAGDASAKLVHFAAATFAAVGVYQIGRRVGVRVGQPCVAHLACLSFLYSPIGVYSVIGSAYSEGTASLAIVAATLAWIVWLDSPRVEWLRVAALLAGLAVTFKLTAVLFPVALAALTTLIVRRFGRQATDTAELTKRHLGLLALLCTAPIIPWMIRSLAITGNPVFPVFARWIPSKDFPPERSEAFETYNRYMIWGNQIGNGLSLGERRAVLIGVGALIAILGGIVYVRLRDDLARMVTLVLVPTLIAQLYVAGLYFRYWTPLASVLVIPIIALAVSRFDVRLVQLAVAVLTLVFVTREVRTGIGDDAELALAAIDDDRRDEVLVERVPLLPLYDAVSEMSTDGEAVLMGAMCAGYYIDSPVLCAATIDTSIDVTDWDRFIDDLDEAGVVYVLAPTSLGAGGPPPTDVGARSVSDFVLADTFDVVSRLLQQRGELLATVQDQSLYRIRGT